MTRDAWINDFITELMRLRSHLTLKVATAIAAHEWVRSQLVEPGEAARRYAAEQDMSGPKR